MVIINGLRFGYPAGGRELFRDLSLNLPAGRIYGLLGRNGAGKTTLLKLIDGLQRGTGDVRVLDHPSALRLPDMLAEIYVVPEELHTPALSMAEHVGLYAPFYHRFDRARMAGLLAEFGLPPAGMISTLSYGQKKKYFLAFGLATGSRLLILDEPTNGLDIPSKSQFRNLLAQHRHPDRTIIISTHQVRDVDNLIDTVIVLDNGAILLNEPLDQVAQRLTFGVGTVSPANAVYTELVPGGTAYAAVRSGGEPTRVDLELLFNAVVAKPDEIRRICAKEGV